jgi:hypothetical protein
MPALAPAATGAVAQELVSLCRAGRNLDAIAKLYSTKIVSIEPAGVAALPSETTGIDAIRRKNEWWFANYEIHDVEVNGPFVGEHQFAVQYDFETTFRPTGRRGRMSEMALYTVQDGKIVREQFFYNHAEA